MPQLDSTEMNKLSFEIFSILENRFLFGGYDSSPQTPAKTTGSDVGKIRILSIDADGDLLAAVSLSRLESSLRSRDPDARIADLFDVVAGSGAGGVLAAMLFSRGADGRPLHSADEALLFLAKNRRSLATKSSRGFRGMFRQTNGTFRRLFGGSTLRDTLKPVLIPCYDLSTGAPFLFSRADAIETDGYDFKMSDVCAATCADRTVEMRSVDGRTKIAAVGGGVAMSNPTAAAITHVLNNKQEFPFSNGVEDLLVLSLGNGGFDSVYFNGTPSKADLLRMVGNGVADTVDQAIAMAFGRCRTSSYVRIQANGFRARPSSTKSGKPRDAVSLAEEMLARGNVESVLFQGKKISQLSSVEKMEKFCQELIQERERRKSSPIPTFAMKHQASTVTPPRSSSATSCSTTTTAVTSSSMDSR